MFLLRSYYNIKIYNYLFRKYLNYMIIINYVNICYLIDGKHDNCEDFLNIYDCLSKVSPKIVSHNTVPI